MQFKSHQRKLLDQKLDQKKLAKEGRYDRVATKKKKKKRVLINLIFDKKKSMKITQSLIIVT